MAAAKLKKETILVVDGSYANRLVLRTVLSHYGFSVIEAVSGEEALGIFSTTKCDAVLLDIRLPRLGGLEICRIIRKTSSQVPIIMMTALVSEDLMVEAFEQGADDYISKPYHRRELVARVSAAVRRSKLLHGESTEIAIGDITIEPMRYWVAKRGQPIHMSRKQFELLRYLMERAGSPVPHANLLQSVWGPEFSNKHEYLRTFVRALRLKIEDDPANPRYLVTDACFGYRFTDTSLFEKTA